MISEVIVKKAQNGDDEAFASLYESVYKDMYRMAYYMLGRKRMPRMQWQRRYWICIDIYSN